MKNTLRPYQHAACLRTITARRNNPLLVAPTGAGKTTMGVYIAQALAESSTVTWIAHRTELIDQAVERFGHHGIDVGVIQADRPVTPDARVQVASVQTLARRSARWGSVFIVDEAHRAAAESYRRVIGEDSICIGLTATPHRNDGRGLGDMFGEIVTAATTAELVEAGTLMNPEVWVVRPPDMKGVTKRQGDYAIGESAGVVNTPERRADIVEQWRERCEGTRTLAFAVNVDHSKAIAAAFCEAGIPAEHVDAETPAGHRKEAIARLASGETQVLSNCMLFTEGFDLPAVESLIIARPTQSLALHMQMVGRVMRRSEGKDRAVVNDHAGNHLRLGRVTQSIEFSLDAGATREPSEPLGLTHCGECFRLFAGVTCPSCGAEREASDREAIEIDGEAGMVQMSEHDIREAAFDRFCEEQMIGDRKDGWVLHRFKEEFGEWPPVCRPEGEDGPMLYVNPDRAGMDIKRAFYRDMLAVAVEKGFKPGWASVRYRDVFNMWPKGFVAEVKAELGVEEEMEVPSW